MTGPKVDSEAVRAGEGEPAAPPQPFRKAGYFSQKVGGNIRRTSFVPRTLNCDDVIDKAPLSAGVLSSYISSHDDVRAQPPARFTEVCDSPAAIIDVAPPILSECDEKANSTPSRPVFLAESFSVVFIISLVKHFRRR